LVERDHQELLLTLSNEHGDELASATAPAGEAAIKSAVMLLARSETLRPGYRLMVSMEGDGAKR
jgi:hypothetical protein